METIAAIANKIQPGETWQRTPPALPTKSPQRVSLDDLDLSNPLVANAVQTARKWAKRKMDGYEDASLILSGPYGTGKTHIAKAILWSIRYEVPNQPNAPTAPAGLFFMANDLLTKLAPVDSNWGTAPAKVKRVLGWHDLPDDPMMPTYNPPLIVIDDVGGEMSLSFIKADKQMAEIQARYFRVINFCYEYQISVIITTNLSIEGLSESQFARHIGGAAFDRLIEMAPSGFMVGMAGVPSWRQKAGGR
jgi:DNA replication protein DnaC